MSRLTPIFLLAALSGCGDDEDRQPTAAEVQRYTAQIDRAEAEAKAKAVQTSRRQEQSRNEKHLARVPAKN